MKQRFLLITLQGQLENEVGNMRRYALAMVIVMVLLVGALMNGCSSNKNAGENKQGESSASPPQSDTLIGDNQTMNDLNDISSLDFNESSGLDEILS